ncbi:MAG: 3'-5' exonuclease [Bacteroidales bacterium]|jgi:predicted PolB exonuclease-like 3'-5' exonuclease|nr:3'-5' exonuclease [Bacteroidales bacterium]
MKILQGVRPEDIIFIDIETVPSAPSFDALEQHFQILWEKKSKHFRSEEESAGDVYNRAGIYAEFGKIICISAGVITGKDPFSFRLKSFYGDDENHILSDFSSMLAKFSRNRETLLCAHNGKEFDYPYISRRMIINRITIPDLLDTAGRKPWEIKLIDTMDLWKFGDFKSYTSLDLLTSVLNIRSPKDDIDGGMVADLYYNEGELKRIVRYCEKDVLAVAQVLLRFLNLPQINGENVESVTPL